MKKNWLLFCTFYLLAVGVNFAQDVPEKVVSLVKDSHPYDWYIKQYELWNKISAKKPKNEEAWENTYAAARMAGITSPSDADRKNWQTKQKEIIALMAKAIKDTYTYYYLMSWEYSVWSTSDPIEQKKIMDYSLKAYSLNPSNPATYPDLMTIYEVADYQPNKLVEIAKKWKASGDHTPNLMAYAYNILLSTKSNGIVISGGDNDTYPVWIAQHADGFRTDVTVINIYLATLETYRNRLFKQLNIPELKGNNLSFDQIINHIITYKKTRELYFTSNGIVGNYKDIVEKLYCTGLIYQYAPEPFNNDALIVDNFENRLLTNHLFYPYYQSKSISLDKNFDCMYLSGLISLYEHYQLVSDKNNAEKIKQVLLHIAENTDFMSDVKKVLHLD